MWSAIPPIATGNVDAPDRQGRVNNGREQPQQILPEIIANFGDAG
jgi:hypothetical protein